MPPNKHLQLRWRSLVLVSTMIVWLGVNSIAFMQAWAMTHFAAMGQRTEAPEQLSFGAKLWTIVRGVTIPRPENVHTPAFIARDYSVHRIAQRDGTKLEGWFLPHPDADGVVLLFHGYAVSKDTLLAPAAAFHRMGFDTLLVDFHGSGGSSGRETSLGVREGGDVAQAVTYVQQSWPGKPIILYGVSMGAAAVLRAIATEGVNPTAIILESPFDALRTTVGNRVRAMGLPAFPGAELVVFWGSVQQGFNGFVHNPVDYATTVRCPTLLLHGEQDVRATTEQVTAIFANLGGRKQFVRFPTAGHELLITVGPTQWEEQVTQFLQSVATSGMTFTL